MLSQQVLQKTMDEQVGTGAVPARRSDDVGPSKDSRFVLLKTRPTLLSNGHALSVAENAAPGVEPGMEEGTPASKTEQQKAFRLLEDVKDFIPKILQENELLRQNLLALKSQAEAEIESADARSREWEEANRSMKLQVETLEAMVFDLRGKLQRAEGAAAIEKELSSKISQEAAEAECIAKLFEDTVIQSFGAGSMFQNALARIGDAKI